MLETLGELPILICAARGLSDVLLAAFFSCVPVVDPFALKPCMKEVGPGDDRGHNEKLGAESQPAAVECVNGSNHRLPGLDEQLVAPERKAGFGVNFRPGCDETVQFVLRRSFRRSMLGSAPDFSNGTMID